MKVLKLTLTRRIFIVMALGARNSLKGSVRQHNISPLKGLNRQGPSAGIKVLKPLYIIMYYKLNLSSYSVLNLKFCHL